MDITPGHKLYKETNNASDQKSKGFKPQGMANMTSNEAITTADTATKTTSGLMFTPEQFGKMLQLLDIEATPSTPTIPEVNMAALDFYGALRSRTSDRSILDVSINLR